jgi:NADP-dependent 3-hydroxy acid dehydrogenase YdfG
MAQKVWRITGVSRGFGKKLAQALIQLANATEPPVRLPLGSDTLARIAEETGKWRELSASTDFQDAARPSGA